MPISYLPNHAAFPGTSRQRVPTRPTVRESERERERARARERAREDKRARERGGFGEKERERDRKRERESQKVSQQGDLLYKATMKIDFGECRAPCLLNSP